jgi:predicted site-specific integrase-resolvase
VIYGCARVSTAAQDLASQLAELKAAESEKVFREVASEAKMDRAQEAVDLADEQEHRRASQPKGHA